MYELKSRFIAENNAESALEKLAKEVTVAWNQGLGLLLNNVKYGVFSAGIGALLGYANSADNISIIEGAKQVIIAGLPNVIVTNIDVFFNFNNFQETAKKIDRAIYISENRPISVLKALMLNTCMYYATAFSLKLFGIDMDPSFCAQGGIMYGIASALFISYM